MSALMAPTVLRCASRTMGTWQRRRAALELLRCAHPPVTRLTLHLQPARRLHRHADVDARVHANEVLKPAGIDACRGCGAISETHRLQLMTTSPPAFLRRQLPSLESPPGTAWSALAAALTTKSFTLSLALTGVAPPLPPALPPTPAAAAALRRSRNDSSSSICAVKA